VLKKISHKKFILENEKKSNVKNLPVQPAHKNWGLVVWPSISGIRYASAGTLLASKFFFRIAMRLANS
jgi:hypothetical protein